MKLTEKMVENAFCQWLPTIGGQVIKQQAETPCGIADVVFWFDDHLYVAEIKEGKAPDSAFAQLYGYVAAIEHMIWAESGIYPDYTTSSDVGKVSGVLVAESLGARTAGAIYFGESYAYFNAMTFISYEAGTQGISFQAPAFEEPYRLAADNINWTPRRFPRPAWMKVAAATTKKAIIKAEQRRSRDGKRMADGGGRQDSQASLGASIAIWRKGAR